MKKLIILLFFNMFNCVYAQSDFFHKDENHNLNQSDVWESIYRRYFNINIDIDSLIEPKEGKWSIFVAKGLTVQQVFDVLPFKKWKYTNTSLDKLATKNDRVSDRDYVVYVDQNTEASTKLKEISITSKGITLLERLLLELFYFEITKKQKHLDEKTITLCLGSKNPHDKHAYACVYWRKDKLFVHWCRCNIPCKEKRIRSRLVNLK